MKHYVYFIQCCDKKSKAIKIGVAKNVSKRLDVLQIGCPYKLKVLDIYEFDSKAKAYAIENRLHRFFKRKNIRGEWFKSSIKWNDLDFLPQSTDDTYTDSMLAQIHLVNKAGFFIE